MVPPEQMDAASAAGWSQASKMVNPDGEHKWVPNDQAEDLKTKGWTPIEADGSFNIQPTEGESFQDTMKRAANAGKWLAAHPAVSKPLIDQQTKKGLKDAPLALAAGPAIAGAQISTGVAAGAALPKVIPAGIEGAKALGTWASAHPIQAYVLYHIIKDLVPFGKKTIDTIHGLPGE